MIQISMRRFVLSTIPFHKFTQNSPLRANKGNFPQHQVKQMSVTKFIRVEVDHPIVRQNLIERKPGLSSVFLYEGLSYLWTQIWAIERTSFLGPKLSLLSIFWEISNETTKYPDSKTFTDVSFIIRKNTIIVTN